MNAGVSGASGIPPQQAPQNNENIDAEIEKLQKKQDKSKSSDSKTSSVKKPSNLAATLLQGGSDAKEDAFFEQLSESRPEFSKRQAVYDKQLQDEMGKLFNSKKQAGDIIQLSQQFGEVAGDLDDKELKELRKESNRQDKSNLKAEKIQSDQQSTSKQLSLIHSDVYSKFTSSFGDYALDDTPENRKKLNESKAELKKQGMSQKQLMHFESSMGSVLRQHMMYDLKSTILNEYFLEYDDPNSSDEEQSNQKISQRQAKLASGTLAKKLQSMDQTGVLKTSSLGVLERVGHELRSELEAFVFDEVAHNITKVSLDQMSHEDYIAQMRRFAQAAQAAGMSLNLDQLTDKVNRAIEDHGLAYFSAPAGSGQSFDEGDEAPKKPVQLYVNQQELLEDKLRHLYMQQLMVSSIKESIGLRFKLTKVKNGLIKLGIFTDDRQDQLLKEGQLLAEIKLREQLVDGFKEQATLDRRSGPAFKLIQSKRVFCLKQLEKCGINLKKSELNNMRDQQNLDMGVYVNDQIRQLDISCEVRETKYLLVKRRNFHAVLDQLVRETPVLLSLLSSSSYVNTEQITEDMA